MHYVLLLVVRERHDQARSDKRDSGKLEERGLPDVGLANRVFPGGVQTPQAGALPERRGTLHLHLQLAVGFPFSLWLDEQAVP